MKRFVFVFTVVLLALAILSVGCGSTAPAAPAAPAAPPAATTVTGILKDINTPTEPGKDVVVVQTPQGLQTLTITPDTKFTLEGGACPLEDAGKLTDQGNVTYNCTVQYDEYYNLAAVAIWKVQ